jgi:hypothetical protein
MPRFDGTGPRGEGPFTGHGEGYCAVRRPDGDEAAVGFAGRQGRPVRLSPSLDPATRWSPALRRWPRRSRVAAPWWSHPPSTTASTRRLWRGPRRRRGWWFARRSYGARVGAKIARHPNERGGPFSGDQYAKGECTGRWIQIGGETRCQGSMEQDQVAEGR